MGNCVAKNQSLKRKWQKRPPMDVKQRDKKLDTVKELAKKRRDRSMASETLIETGGLWELHNQYGRFLNVQEGQTDFYAQLHDDFQARIVKLMVSSNQKATLSVFNLYRSVFKDLNSNLHEEQIKSLIESNDQ